MTPEFEPRRHSLSPVLRAQAVMLGLEVEFGVHGVRGWETSGRCSPMSRAGDDTFATAERQVLDTLVDAGDARSRSEARTASGREVRCSGRYAIERCSGTRTAGRRME